MNYGVMWSREEGKLQMTWSRKEIERERERITEEVAEGEVLAGGPVAVVDFGVFEEVVPAKRAADGVVLVGINIYREINDKGEEEEEEDQTTIVSHFLC